MDRKLIQWKSNNVFEIIDSDDFDPITQINQSYITTWANQGLTLSDYVIVRDIIKSKVIELGFDNLKSGEKDIVAYYCATADPMTLIGYYMSLGMTATEAQMHYLDVRAQDIRNARDASSTRIQSKKYIRILITYLSVDDAQTYLEESRQLSFDYEQAAVMGTAYGDGRDGIMDYVEGTGSYEDPALGLSRFPINDPFTLEMMVAEIHSLLVDGDLK